MTMDFTGSPNDRKTPDTSDAPMFAPVPAWERNRKRRSFGRRAVEPRSFAAMDEMETDTLSPTPASGDTGFMAGPAFANRPRRTSKSSIAPIAVVAGIIVVGGLAAAGWYATQPHDEGIAALTPGEAASTSTTTTTTSSSAPGDQQLAQSQDTATPPAADQATKSVDSRSSSTRVLADGGTRTKTVTKHVRSTSRSADQTTADVSATAPAQPAPAAAPAPSAVVPPPVTVAPAPSPQTAPAQPAPQSTLPTQEAPPTATPPADTTPPTTPPTAV